MSRTQERTTDLMFVVGLFTAPISCGAQIMRTLTTTNGVSFAHYVAFTFSFVIGLVLALDSRRENPGRIITQQVYLFAMWAVGGIAMIATVILRGNYHWSSTDTVITILVLVGVVSTVFWAASRKISVKDPAVKAWTSISLKSVPQFLLVRKIFLEGGSGITGAFIVVGHISILMRLVPLVISAKTSGMDRSKYWLIVAEILNSLSWLAVTLIWSLK
ncbi:MAG: hypothetical protein AAB617_01050 [Patescibacteria group bacterium]